MQDSFQNINIFVRGVHIQREPQVKILGVHLDENLKWTKHIQQTVKNVKYQYRAFSRAIKYLDRDTRLMLYNSSLASRFNYADCVWSHCSKRDGGALQTVQNMAARRIMNAGPLESSQPILAELGLLTLEKKRLLRSLVLMFKLVNGQGPKELTDELAKYIRPTSHVSGTRMGNISRYWIPYYNTDYKGTSFFIRMIKEWNRLPADLVNSASSDAFKRGAYLLLTTGSTPSHCGRNT